MSLKQEVFAEDNPLTAFANVFGTTSGGNPMSDAAAMLLAARKKSVLDNATADLATLSSRRWPTGQTPSFGCGATASFMRG